VRRNSRHASGRAVLPLIGAVACWVGILVLANACALAPHEPPRESASRGVTFTPGDVESGTLGVLVDRYGDPREGAPEMLAAARAGGG
jgi:hypothetical protein